MFCLIFFPLAKAELFLANVQQSRGGQVSLGDIKGKMSDDQRTGEDYSLKKQFEEKENGSKSEENSDDQIFHQSKKNT